MRVYFRLGVGLAVLITLATVGPGVFDAFGYVSKLYLRHPTGKPLPAYLFLPHSPPEAPLPCVIVGVGVGSQEIFQYHVHCQCLADRGFAVLLFDPSNYPESLVPGPIDWDRGVGYARGAINQTVVAVKLRFTTKWYFQSLKAAVDFFYFSPNFDRHRIVLSGYSQPANAALTYACKDKRVKAVIWNYGGSPWVMPYDPFKLPPVLIFHGARDDVYDVKYARKLISNLDMTNRLYEAYIYPHQKHMFRVYFDPRRGETRYMKPMLLDAFERQIAFLCRVLGLPHR